MSTELCEPWPLVVEVHEAGMVYTEVQVRCGCRESLALDYGHELLAKDPLEYKDRENGTGS